MIDNDDFLRCLGLARKAGKLVIGWDRIEKIKVKPCLIIISDDISERTKRNVENQGCEIIQTDLSMDIIGAALGINKVAVIAVTDGGFAEILKKKYIKQTE